MNVPHSSGDTASSSVRGLRALTEFFRLEAAGGIVLIAAALLAMLAANSPLAPFYDAFRNLPVHLRIGDFEIAISASLLWRM